MDSLIEVFHIDVKILIAQIINFGIVFAALYFLVLKPLLKMMKERSEKIEGGLKFSEQVEKDVKELQEKRGHILSEAQKKADAELENAKKMAEEKKKEILEEAQKKAQELSMVMRVQGEDERQKIVDRSKGDVLDLSFAIVAKVLGKKIGEKEDKEFTEKFIKNL